MVANNEENMGLKLIYSNYEVTLLATAKYHKNSTKILRFLNLIFNLINLFFKQLTLCIITALVIVKQQMWTAVVLPQIIYSTENLIKRLQSQSLLTWFPPKNS